MPTENRSIETTSHNPAGDPIDATPDTTLPVVAAVLLLVRLCLLLKITATIRRMNLWLWLINRHAS
jgi:hypothetical protein